MSLSARERAIKYYDEHFLEDWRKIFDAYSKEENKLWLAGPSSYVFSLSGERFAVDLQIRRQTDFDSLLPGLLEDVKHLSAIIITHEHEDHLCIPLMKLLKDSQIIWYLPADCRRELVFATGIGEDKIVWVAPGDTFSLGNVKFRAFYTPHGLPGNEPCFERGYEITAPEANILIPGDIRDYSYNGYPVFSDVDLCIAHLWAGNNAIDKEAYFPLLKDFVNRSAGFGAKRYFLCHLYEIAREEQFLWHHTHAEEAIELFSDILPEATISIPELGNSYSLQYKEKN